MSEQIEAKIDKSAWPPGPWHTEPDRVEWKTEAGYPALIIRVSYSGHLCGYVAVPPGHPAHGHSYATEYETDANGERDYDKPRPNPLNGIRVHGGITYTEKCAGRVCHVPAPGEPDDVWWVGFDCNHAYDLAPNYGSAYRTVMADYRDVDYVREQCELLAEQLKPTAGGAR